MTRVARHRLLQILEDDEEIVMRLIDEGLIVERDDGFDSRDVERALVARTLLRELEVNWPGVEVALVMREQLRETHLQVAEVLAALHAAVRRR